jgi:hypothetical protein
MRLRVRLHGAHLPVHLRGDAGRPLCGNQNLRRVRADALKLPYQLLPDAARSLQACGLRFLAEADDLAEDQEVSSIAQQDHPLLTGENDSENEHAPSPTDVFAAEPYERSPKKKQRVA